ncbi:hypothetical protein FPV67DRAFT_1541639 [Lyophyllum atratum]|nr:hypothetical protein FPV67DRAFT_1541639 [Lyophyllum atratum]
MSSVHSPPITLEPVTVWYDDGNLLIHAEDSSFLVYGGLLVASSSVFRDMFAVSQPVPKDESAVLHLQDSPYNLSSFLRALHDMEFFLPPPAPSALPKIAGILRLSIKYDVPYLRRRAILHLSSIYPTSLWKPDSAPLFYSYHISDHITTLRLASECNLPWIRPMAIYACSLSDIPTIVASFRSHPLELDLTDCLSQKYALKNAQWVNYSYLHPPCLGSASDTRRCLAARKAAWEELVLSVTSEEGPDILAGHNRDLDGSPDICASCRTRYRDTAKLLRRGVFDESPRAGQSWDVLGEMKELALRS